MFTVCWMKYHFLYFSVLRLPSSKASYDSGILGENEHICVHITPWPSLRAPTDYEESSIERSKAGTKYPLAELSICNSWEEVQKQHQINSEGKWTVAGFYLQKGT